MRHYIAVLIPEDDGWSVVFPDLIGCATQGDTLDEALEMASDALAGYVASMLHHGDKLPEPRSVEEIKADRAFAREFEVHWPDVLVAPIAVRPPLGKPARVTVSLDSNFLSALDAYAERRDLTRSAALTAGGELLMRMDPVISAGKKPKTTRAGARKS